MSYTNVSKLPHSYVCELQFHGIYLLRSVLTFMDSAFKAVVCAAVFDQINQLYLHGGLINLAGDCILQSGVSL